MDEKCFFAYIFREKRGISKNRAATNSVEGCASKKEQSREPNVSVFCYRPDPRV